MMYDNCFEKFLKLSLILFLSVIVSMHFSLAVAKDARQNELKYVFGVLKDDEQYKRDKKILELNPSGYMTVEEYEKRSEYKDRSTIDTVIPKINTPSDFMYVPKPLYSIVKYNDPPGSPELSLGKRIYSTHQINAQGIVSPDFSKLVYPAVYYYADSASIAADVFVIPLTDGDTNLNKILKANVAKRNPNPILSTDKVIDNFAAFRSLTPVDFSSDGAKILLKRKIGSSEDGIWETTPYVYDFNNKTDYDLSAVRDAIVYFWKEYMELNLDDARWDIYPLGFSKDEPDRVVVQAFAFTGVTPVFLGTWSIDSMGNQSKLVSFDKNFIPNVSSNGYKLVKDGVEDYQSVKIQEKFDAKETKYLKKQAKAREKELVKEINDEYKYTVRALKDDYKDDKRDLKKLISMSGSTEDVKLQEAYKKYLIDQLNKDIQKTQKQIEKNKKQVDKIDNKLDKLYQEAGLSSKVSPKEEQNSDSNEVELQKDETQEPESHDSEQ